MTDLLNNYMDFMDRGGLVLWAILSLTIILVWMIIERFWFFVVEFNDKLNARVDMWHEREERNSWYSIQLRRQLISELDCEMSKNLKSIPVMIALLPMFGLLGTVTGMIQVFDVMASMGSGNARAMANGVSAATIPTMSGMVVALFALPFATRLERIYRVNKKTISEKINQD